MYDVNARRESLRILFTQGLHRTLKLCRCTLSYAKWLRKSLLPLSTSNSKKDLNIIFTKNNNCFPIPIFTSKRFREILILCLKIPIIEQTPKVNIRAKETPKFSWLHFKCTLVKNNLTIYCGVRNNNIVNCCTR